MIDNDFVTQSEQEVIGSLLIDNNVFDELEALQSDAFFAASHRIMYSTISEMIASGKLVDLVLLAEELDRRGELEQAGGLAYIGSIVNNCGAVKNAKPHANKIINQWKLRRLKALLAELDQEINEHQPIEQILVRAEKEMFSLLEGEEESRTVHIKQAVIEAVEWEDQEFRGVQTGLRDLDRMIGGMGKSDLVIIAGRPSMGKAQPLTSRILLQDGNWKSMKDACIGDKLASVDGEDSEIIGIYPQGIRKIYQITSSDGRVIEADEEHLWRIESCRFFGERTVTTKELKSLISKARYKGRINIVSHSGDFGKDSLNIDPWLLGFLLGDGCLSSGGVKFSNPEPYILERVADSSGMEIRSQSAVGCDYAIFHARGVPHPIKEELKNLKVAGLLSYEKSIPDLVMTCNKSTREKVLAGLLESDGWVEKTGSIQFSSSSEILADGVIKLVHSLGGSARKRIKKYPAFRYKDEIKIGRPAYIVSINLGSLSEFIKSPRLLKNLKQRVRSLGQGVSSVEYSREEIAQCIAVSHQSKLYITDGYTVTHNTSLAMQIAEHVANTEAVAVFSLEMSRRQVGSRMLSFHENRVGKSQAIAHLSNMKLHIDDKPAATIQHIRSECRKIKRKAGLSMIVIDYLQLMTGSGDNRNQEIGAISRGLKGLAKEFDVPLIALSQLSRRVDDRSDKKPLMSDLRDSGEIEQDADLILFIYRDEVYFPDSDFKGLAEIICRKNRNGATGEITTTFDGQHTRFKDYNGQPILRSVKTTSRGFD